MLPEGRNPSPGMKKGWALVLLLLSLLTLVLVLLPPLLLASLTAGVAAAVTVAAGAHLLPPTLNCPCLLTLPPH